eukprot:m.142489 g.142489  ORF g.142489 m.142489 type:complete len:81 (-) comp22925_c0_seq1:1187-1429(-)
MTIMWNTRNTAGLETPRCALGSASRAGALVHEENAWTRQRRQSWRLLVPRHFFFFFDPFLPDFFFLEPFFFPPFAAFFSS